MLGKKEVLIAIVFIWMSSPIKAQSLKVLAFGDGGTGRSKQYDVAESMKRVCTELGCDIAIMLGDNIYENGVKSSDDEQFIYKFERPYSPLNIPFYVSLGNHDNRGDTEAQVEYSQISQLWKMPARYYDFVIGNSHFIAIDSNKFDMKLLNYQDGDENGIKDVSIEIKGLHSYGKLKAERGVHRLVRISPFDSNSRRHTSFASVFVYPIIDNDINLVINESELKVDTYRASGAGGQHVNKTDSAVRITHMKSGIVVQCQNQRSQLKNKNIAMKILKSKLYQIKLDEKNAEKDNINSNKKDIAWGSQIRSYIFHPYNLVKDHRTKYETSDIENILDGNIDTFVRKYLLYKMEK